MGCCSVCDGPGTGVCAERKAEQRRLALELLARVYPTRRFGDFDDEARFRRALSPRGLEGLRRTVGRALEAPTFLAPDEGGADDLGDYIHVLCVGREPCLLALTRPSGAAGPRPATPARDLYLRAAVSSLGPFAAVQEVELKLDVDDAAAPNGVPLPRLRLEGRVRPGVYDELLLPRYRRLVDALDRTGIVHLDFDVLLEEVAGFDGAPYRDRFGVEPTLWSYLFGPCPASHRSTEYLDGPAAG